MTEDRKAGALTNYTRGNNVVATMSSADRAKALASTTDDTKSGSGGGDFLSFSGKTGIATIGREKEDALGLCFIVDVDNIFTGWVLWKRSKTVTKHRWSAFDPSAAIPESDLADPGELNEKGGDGWHKLSGFVLINADDELTPEERQVAVIFETNSTSGRNAFADLMAEISKRIANEQPEYPMFQLGRESFMAQDQKNWKPHFEVECWFTKDEVASYVSGERTLEAIEEGEAEPEPAPAPSRRRRAAA